MRFPFVKRYFGHTKLYQAIRDAWCNHLRSIPRRRLQRHGLAALKLVAETLQGTSAQYFADYGTLLGIVRDHGFILHDDDIDFTVVAGSISPAELFTILNRSNELTFSHAFEFRGQITEITFLYKKIEVDFFFTYVKEDGMTSFIYQAADGDYRVLYGRHWQALRQTRSAVQTIATLNFRNVDLNVPECPDCVLRETYGNWETPIEGWGEMMDCGQKPYVKVDGFSTIVDSETVLKVGKMASKLISGI